MLVICIDSWAHVGHREHALPHPLQVESSLDLFDHDRGQSLLSQLAVNGKEVNFSYCHCFFVYTNFQGRPTDEAHQLTFGHDSDAHRGGFRATQ